MVELPCPDGYLLHTASPLADGHHALNTYLVRVEEAGWKIATKELNAIRDKRLKMRVWMALLERLHWLHGHNAASTYFQQLHDLTYAIEQWKLAPSAEELIHVLDRTGEGGSFIMPYSPMKHLMAYVEEHGLTRELSAAVERFSARVQEAGYRVNQTSLQLLNSRLDMLAWWDEWSAIDLKRCWSERIRADFRAMQGAEREHWRRILHSIQGDEGVRPAPKWLKAAEAQLEAIGRDAFRATLLGWFEPLRAGQIVRLSREGSFLLRSFIWLGQTLNDAEVTSRCGEIAAVEFKPKKNAEKVLRAAAEAVGQPDPAVRKLPPLPTLDQITSRAIAAVFTPGAFGGLSPEAASRVTVQEGIVRIQGERDNYTLHLSTGAVFRESDGVEIDVPVGETPFGSVGYLMSRILKLAGLGPVPPTD